MIVSQMSSFFLKVDRRLSSSSLMKARANSMCAFLFSLWFSFIVLKCLFTDWGAMMRVFSKFEPMHRIAVAQHLNLALICLSTKMISASKKLFPHSVCIFSGRSLPFTVFKSIRPKS